MKNNCNKTSILANINRVAGQVQGVSKMVETDREVGDILQQVTASASALKSIARQLLVHHSNGCFEQSAKVDKKNFEKLIEQIFKTM